MGLLALAANAVGGATGIGAISALGGALGGTLADQWKEFFYCDSIDADTLMVKGQKRTGKRSSNTKGTDNIITKGSVIAVADGQCMIIVDNGKVAELCAQPGEFVYDSSTEPSIFAGNLGQSIIDTFKEIGKRFTFGGEPPKDQRVYYVNTKELIGNKFGTVHPINFMIDDDRRDIHLAVDIRCFGTYSYHITDPIRFYTGLAGNVPESYKRSAIDEQLRDELLEALQPAIGRLSGIPYDKISLHNKEISGFLKEELSGSDAWKKRGIEIESFALASVNLDEKDKELVKNAYRDANYGGNAKMGVGGILYNSGAAMTAAANNANGAVNGFMGMGMLGGMGGGMGMAAMQQLNAMNQQPQPNAYQQPAGYSLGGAPQQAAPAQQSASVPLGKPSAAAGGAWKCPKCGAIATGKFCPECGTPKPAEAAGWTCSCGAVNKGKFCQECGKPKPSGVPLYRCDKCGWEPDDPSHPPKFCPQCGDPFNEGDIVGAK